MAPAVTAPSKSRRAYDFIKERISSGDYTPGFRLVLGQLAAELDISVVPVREAIRLLEAEGLVSFERNVGAQVAMLDPTEYEITMQTLSLVEGYATADAAPRLRIRDIQRARAINRELQECLAHFDPVNFTRLNREFHAVLFEHCRNPHVLDLVERGWARLRALRESTFSFVPGRARQSVAEHDALLDLIERGAPALEIELAARNHRLATLEAFLAYEASRGSHRDDRSAIPQGAEPETRNRNRLPGTDSHAPTRSPFPEGSRDARSSRRELMDNRKKQENA